MRPAIAFSFGLLLLGSFAAKASAELAPLRHVDLSTPAKRESSRLSTESAKALMRGDYTAALTAADQGIAVNPDDPWPYYDRGVALAGSGRVDQAVTAFQQAEVHFGTADPWGRSVAIWRRAYALSEVGRCDAASAAFGEYATFVAQADSAAADMARQYAGYCRTPSAKPVAQTSATSSHQ